MMMLPVAPVIELKNACLDLLVRKRHRLFLANT
jgi:hypothetical protein